MARSIRPSGRTFDEGDQFAALRGVIHSPRDVLTGIGALIRKESARAFREQKLGKERWPERPNPNWAAVLSDMHEGRTPPQRRFRSRPVLQDTGRLKGSVAWRLVGTDSVEVGSNLPYAGPLHAGEPTETVIVTETIQTRLWKWIQKLSGSAVRAAKKSGKERTDEAKAKATQSMVKAEGANKLRWLLNPDLRGSTITVNHPERPIVGLPDTLIDEVERLLGVAVGAA